MSFCHRHLSPRAVRRTGASVEWLEPRTLFNNTTYYVSPSGSDSNSGRSITQPWQTITKVNGVTFFPGDKILFQGGATFSGSVVFGADDVGSSSSPITVSSYGTGRALLVPGASGTGDGLLIYDTGGYSISNINLAGAGIGVNLGSGINLFNDLPGSVKKSHVYIDHVDVKGFKTGGIVIGGWLPSSGFNDVRITNSVVHDNDAAGVFSYLGDYQLNPAPFGYAHTNIYVGHVLAYGNTGHAGTNASGNGIQLGNVDGGVIERCVARNNGSGNNGTAGGPVGIWAFNSNNVVIQFNESHHNVAGHKDGGGFDLDGGCTNCVMQYNYSHDNYGAGYLLAEFPNAHPFVRNVVRYNLSQNDGRQSGYSGIEIGSTSSATPFTSCEIYGNTIYVTKPSASSSAGLIIKGPTKDLHVRNNIFYAVGGTFTVVVEKAGTGMLLQGNDYWTGSSSTINLRWLGSTYTTLAAWRTASGQEKVGSTAVGRSVAPQLSNAGGGGTLNDADKLTTITAYKLQSTSPLIDAGVDLKALGVAVGTVDYFNDTTPQGKAFDVGAHETTPLAVPDEFTSGDIGGPTPSGQTTVVTSGRDYNVSAAGTRIGGTSDQFRFVYTSITGNFDVKVRVAALSASDAWAKAGLMMRTSLAANAPEFFAFAQAASGSDGVLYRSQAGANATQTGGGAPKFPSAWVRIRRVGNTLTAYYGTTGTTWTQLGTAVTFSNLSSTVFVGMAVNSRVSGKLATAQFRDLLIA